MRRLLTALLITLALAATASAQLSDKKVLTLAAAKKIAAAAEAEMAKNGWRMVIAIVDDGAHLIYLQRGEETQAGSVEIAIRKATSAAMFKRPTKVWEDALAGGRQAILGLAGLVPSEGGEPIMLDGKLLGAIGVSGGTAQQDGQVARTGLGALAKP